MSFCVTLLTCELSCFLDIRLLLCLFPNPNVRFFGCQMSVFCVILCYFAILTCVSLCLTCELFAFLDIRLLLCLFPNPNVRFFGCQMSAMSFLECFYAILMLFYAILMLFMPF